VRKVHEDMIENLKNPNNWEATIDIDFRFEGEYQSMVRKKVK
jgi:hypothetical protein